MSDGNAGNTLISYFAHILHLLAQVYLGFFLILVLPPNFEFFIKLLKVLFIQHPPGDILSFEILFSLFGSWWQNLFLQVDSFYQIFLFFPMLFIIGFVSSEFAYRFGLLVRYHDDLSPFKKPSEGDPDNFSFRCKLLEAPHLQKLWDWEQLQFDLCYYMEIVLALFFLSQGLNLVVYYGCFLITGAVRFDLWASLAILLLMLSGFLWFLAQSARKAKRKNFCNAVEAIKGQLYPSESGGAVNVTDPTTPAQ